MNGQGAESERSIGNNCANKLNVEKYTEYSGKFEVHMLLLNQFIRWEWN